MGGFPDLKRLPSQHRIKDYGVGGIAGLVEVLHRCHFLATFISNTGNIKKLLQIDKRFSTTFLTYELIRFNAKDFLYTQLLHGILYVGSLVQKRCLVLH